MATINVNLLEDLDKYDINDLYLGYLDIFKQRNILNEGQKYGKNIEGNFDEDIWILKNDDTDTNRYVDFVKFGKLIFKGLKNEDIITIKLWVAEMLTREDYLMPSTILIRINVLYEIMEYTDCLSEELLLQGGNPIEDWKDNSERGEKGNFAGLCGLIEYLEYRIEYLNELNDNLEEYLRLAEKVCKTISIKGKVRELPTSKDITAFSYYVEKFFDENKGSNLEIFFYPILIWWKVTNVIPMRTSELCKKLTRDCLVYENGKMFLKIDRVKKNRNPKKHSLPVLDKVEINNDIADMISYYIDETGKFGKTNTLFSYRAYNEIKKDLMEKNEDMPVSYNNGTNPNAKKMNEDNFSAPVFDRLLKIFYDYVINRMYKDSTIKTKIKPMDTRHFAFFSLMLQGLSPIEIALLGGHTTIKSQETYEYEIRYYMDSNLYELIEKNKSSKEDKNESYRKSIKEIVSSMPESPPKNLIKCRELKVGYCTFDFRIEEDEACEDFDSCCFCSKFWCAPSAQNYKGILKMVSNKISEMTKYELIKNAEFLGDLMNDISLNAVQCRDGIDVCMDREQLSKIRTTCNKIKHNATRVNKLRYSMIDLEQLDGKLESVIKSISDTIEVKDQR